MVSTPNVLEVWDSNDDGGVTNQATFTATALASAPADDSLVIIAIHTVRSSTSDTPNSVTAGGKSFTHYQRVEIDTSPSFVSHLDIYYAAGTSWTTAAPVVTFTPTHFGVQIAVLEFTDALKTGTNGIDGLVQQANTRNSSLADSTSMGPTLGAFANANNGTLFVFCTGLNDTTDPNTLDSPLTEIAEMGSTTQFRTTTVGFYTGNETTPSGFHTFGSNGEAGCIAIEIAAAAGGGPTEVGLAGAQPAATGDVSALQTLARSLAGAQPAATGAVTALQTLARSLAGNQPAPTGALATQQALARSLAGNQPAATGAISSESAGEVALAGNQPAATGAVVAVQVLLRSVAGDQPAATGAVSIVQALARSLAGNQPAPTGAVDAVQVLLRALAGNQPAATGTISTEAAVEIALAGNQPTATGAVAVTQQALNRTVTGNQPAPTGAIDALQALARSLAGNQPAATGVIDALQVLSIALAGNQPAASGVLATSAVYLVALAGNQPAATGVVVALVVQPGLHTISQTARSAPSTIIHTGARDVSKITQTGRLG